MPVATLAAGNRRRMRSKLYTVSDPHGDEKSMAGVLSLAFPAKQAAWHLARTQIHGMNGSNQTLGRHLLGLAPANLPKFLDLQADQA